MDRDERKILELARYRDGKLKITARVKRATSKPYKKVLKGMEDEGLIERVNYGIFRLTGKAYNRISKVSCPDCGREFNSVEGGERERSHKVRAREP